MMWVQDRFARRGCGQTCERHVALADMTGKWQAARMKGVGRGSVGDEMVDVGVCGVGG